MSTEVNMGRYVIVNRNGADKYYWTPGVGDCIAVAAWTDNQILFAHLTSHQYLVPTHGGENHTTVTTNIKNFIENAGSSNVIWVTNFKHQPKHLASARLKLGLRTAQLRIAGTSGHVCAHRRGKGLILPI